jgi:hypothetical protein
VRSDVAALVMEEVAPQAVSTATMRTPGEVFKPEAKGETKAETELSRCGGEWKGRRSEGKAGYSIPWCLFDRTRSLRVVLRCCS